MALVTVSQDSNLQTARKQQACWRRGLPVL